VLLAQSNRAELTPFLSSVFHQLLLEDNSLPRPTSTTLRARLVKDIKGGVGGSLGGIFASASLNGVVYFIANDGISGSQLWRSDGTDSGTYIFKRLESGFIKNAKLVTRNNKLIALITSQVGPFAADTESYLWVSDGTLEGTKNISGGESSIFGALNIGEMDFYTRGEGLILVS